MAKYPTYLSRLKSGDASIPRVLFGLAYASALKAEAPIDRSVGNWKWQAPFEPFSSDTASSLSYSCITDDDPFLSASPDEQADAVQPTLSCASQIESGFNSLLCDRPDLADRFVLQGFAAGMPQRLNRR